MFGRREDRRTFHASAASLFAPCFRKKSFLPTQTWEFLGKRGPRFRCAAHEWATLRQPFRLPQDASPVFPEACVSHCARWPLCES